MIQFDCPASSNGNDKNAKNRAANHMVDTAIRKIMSDFQVIQLKLFNLKVIFLFKFVLNSFLCLNLKKKGRAQKFSLQKILQRQGEFIFKPKINAVNEKKNESWK